MGYTNFSKDRFSKDNFTKINFIKTGVVICVINLLEEKMN